MIRLSAEAEPEIYETTRTFGTILENVVVDERGVLDLDERREDREHARRLPARADLERAADEARRATRRNVVFLTADAFGDHAADRAAHRTTQARYHFLSGFTAKLAGTEIGVTEPQPTFSPCFGGPFLPQPPAVYARLLGEKLAEHEPTVWLVNTGWTGGPVGEGERCRSRRRARCCTRRSSGALDDVEYRDRRGLRLRGAARACRASSPSCSTRARPGATRRRTTRKAARARADVPRELREVRADVEPEVAAAGPLV